MKIFITEPLQDFKGIKDYDFAIATPVQGRLYTRIISYNSINSHLSTKNDLKGPKYREYTETIIPMKYKRFVKGLRGAKTFKGSPYAGNAAKEYYLKKFNIE